MLLLVFNHHLKLWVKNPIAQYFQHIILRARSPFQKWRLGRKSQKTKNKKHSRLNFPFIEPQPQISEGNVKKCWIPVSLGKNGLWLVAEGRGNTVFLAAALWIFYLVNLGAEREWFWFKYQILLSFLPNLYIFFLNTCCFICCFPSGQLPELLNGCFKILLRNFTREWHHHGVLQWHIICIYTFSWIYALKIFSPSLKFVFSSFSHGLLHNKIFIILMRLN